ncbi:putative derlin [Helianthus annuus]|nr:putative derlin [Helianthus annuus]
MLGRRECNSIRIVNWLFNLKFCNFLQIISPHILYLNPKLVVEQLQIWRLITNFLYFRNLGKHSFTFSQFGLLLSWKQGL